MILTYEAIDPKGQRVDNTLNAPSVKDGVEELRKQGFFVTKIEEAKDTTASAKNTAKCSNSTSMGLGQLMLFTRQMSMLLTSGSALVPALTAIGPQMKSPVHQKLLEKIRDGLEQGVSLTESLQKYPKCFEASYCAVVAAGESSARLPQMFNRLANIIQKRRAMRNKIIGSLIYPMLLSFLSINIIAVMMFFVVPRFADMFTNLGVELPVSTKVALACSNTLVTFWPLVVFLVISFIAGVIMLVKTNRGKQFLCDIQIKLPLVGKLMSRLIQGQTFRILGMLLEARVGLLEALDLARRVTRNRQYQNLYDHLQDSITRGDSVCNALEKTPLISPAFIQAIRTGEQSGRIGESITYVADVLDEENSELLITVTKLIEPLVLIVMGFVVGTIAVSLFMPLFDMTSAI